MSSIIYKTTKNVWDITKNTPVQTIFYHDSDNRFTEHDHIAIVLENGQLLTIEFQSGDWGEAFGHTTDNLQKLVGKRLTGIDHIETWNYGEDDTIVDDPDEFYDAKVLNRWHTGGYKHCVIHEYILRADDTTVVLYLCVFYHHYSGNLSIDLTSPPFDLATATYTNSIPAPDPGDSDSDSNN